MRGTAQRRAARSSAAAIGALLILAGCSQSTRAVPPAAAGARNLVLVTIDTLRADHVGAYGHAAARTPVLDRLAREGARFERAFTPAPITLTAHASLLSGLYPPGHGARHNGLAVRENVPTLATAAHERGLHTGAFVGAFPLDRRFGLARGFDAYGDRMPRGPSGRAANERPGRAVVDEAIAWLDEQRGPFFLWVHLFEPHAPYEAPPGTDGSAMSAVERYDSEISTADAQVGRLLAELGARRPETLVVVAGDHGEAFGEHGEFTHSLFVYDTTLRVPLVIAGPGVRAGLVIREAVTLVDVAPTVAAILGLRAWPSDGVDLRSALAGREPAPRTIYAESFAPLLDFGWSPLRSVRAGRRKAIAAPRPELYDLDEDAGETRDLAGARGPDLAALLRVIDRFGPGRLASARPAAAEDRARLAALGYVQGGATDQDAAAVRPDPKDRLAFAARLARVLSGEVAGPDRVALLHSLAREEPSNGQVRVRLGDALLEAGDWRGAEGHFSAAIAAHLPSADPYLGLAACQAKRGAVRAAIATLTAADRTEPGNAVVQANLGLLQVRAGQGGDAERSLRRAVTLDPEFHEARFNLALVYARAGNRQAAEAEASELLRRLPWNAPQRPEVERLLASVR
jgi:choline-sulfatase